jgi:hypothetical protein
LGKLEIHAKYKGNDGAVRPIGPVGFRLTCTNPVAFSHQITTSANGHVEIKAPCGKCRLASAYPVRVDGKRYAWKSDVEISPEKTSVDLLAESASAQEGTDAPAESDTSLLVPQAAGGGVEAEFPDLATRARIEGKVILQAVIGVDGLVTGATVCDLLHDKG